MDREFKNRASEVLKDPLKAKGLGASHQTGWTALVAEMIRWGWCK